MKFSAQEEYGLRCLVTLASEGEGGFLTIPQISDREGLTPSHVAKLLSILRKADFVASTRGQLGGYSLAKPPAQTTVRSVLEALGGRLYGKGFCERHSGLLPECVHDSTCLIRPLWTTVQEAVDQAIEGVTIQDILDGKLSSRQVVFHASREDSVKSASKN